MIFFWESRRSKKWVLAASRAYTAVEVLMSISMLLIGASAVMSMERAAIQGNLDARKLDIANQIAHTWVERLRRDAMQWTLPSAANPTGSNISNAQLINGNVTNTWFIPSVYNSDSAPDGKSPAFDILGRDLGPGNYGSAQFCTNIRLNWLSANQLIRAEVRVFWPRNLSYTSTPANFCSQSPDSVTNQTNTYHFVYAATAIGENAQ